MIMHSRVSGLDRFILFMAIAAFVLMVGITAWLALLSFG